MTFVSGLTLREGIVMPDQAAAPHHLERPIVSQALPAPAAFTARLHWRFEDAEALWAQLETSGHSTAYQSRAWIRPILNHLVRAGRHRPFFIEITDAVTHELVMLAPFVVTRWFGVRVISWLNLGVCDYAMPLLASPAPVPAGTAKAAWEAICSVLPPADVIHITQIPAAIGVIDNPLARLPVCVPMALGAFGVALEGDPATCLSRAMGGKAYRDLRRRRRQLESQGTFRFVEAENRTQTEAMFETLLEHRRTRFKKLGREDNLADSKVAGFYLDAALNSLGDQGPVHLFGMCVDGEWVALAYILVHANVFHGILITAGDEKWARFSPGLLMVTGLMEWSAAQGHLYHDMSVGNLPYKADLGAEQRMLYEINEALSPVGSAAVFVRARMLRARQWMSEQPRLFKILQSLRRRLRRAF